MKFGKILLLICYGISIVFLPWFWLSGIITIGLVGYSALLLAGINLLGCAFSNIVASHKKKHGVENEKE